MEQATYSYRTEEIADGIRIHYTKEKQGLALGCFSYIFISQLASWGTMLLFVVIIFLIPGVEVSQLLVPLLVISFGVGIAGTVWYVKRENKKRGDTHFDITPEAIRVDEKTYARKDINAISVKDPRGNTTNQTYVGTTTVVGGTGLMGAAAVGASTAANAAYGVGVALGAQVMKKNFKIVFRYGEVEKELARHLTENAAQSLFKEVVKHLG